MKTSKISESIPRKAEVSININRKKTHHSLTSAMTDLSYTDPATGESDSLDITFSNVDKKYILGSTSPKKGDSISASIFLSNWRYSGEKIQLPLGKFTLDDVDVSGRPLTVKYSALSIPSKTSFKNASRSKTWKSTTLKTIAHTIAKRYKLKLVYESRVIKIKSVKQSSQNDCEFLYALAKKYGQGMKVYCGKIIIYSKAKYEAKASAATLKESDLISWSFKDSLYKTYTGAKMKYTSAGNNKTYTASVGGGKRILHINEKADSREDARLQAIAKLNEENEEATTMEIEIYPNPSIIATSNVTIIGMGRCNGKYSIKKVTHNINRSGYTMKLELRKIQKRINK